MPTGDLPTGDLPTGDLPTGGAPTGETQQVPTSQTEAQSEAQSEAELKEVTAHDDDTLCTIAVENGFRDCKKVRAVNEKYQTRPVRAGEKVKIPEVTKKQESGATEQTHEFERPGLPKRRIWIIQDYNRSTPKEATGDAQPQLAVSNYVPTRQGVGYTTADWVDQTETDYVEAATADPDHFKLLVLDPKAAKDGQAKITVNLRTEKPKLKSDDPTQIERWEAVTEATQAKLENIECERVEETDYYKSCYLRLVVDDDDTKLKRPWGRNDTTTDSGADVSKQTLVTPTVTDKKVEILDLRVQAERMQENCPEANADAKCRVLTLADVGKDEKVLRIKVYRIEGSGVSDADVDKMIENTRLSMAQINSGVELVGGKVYDLPVPDNLIAISDYWGKKAAGGKEMEVWIEAEDGKIVEAKIETKRKATPQQTANALVAAIQKAAQAEGTAVLCRVSPNPPYQESGDNFGGCDILCYRQDGNPAPILLSDSRDPDQKIRDSGDWDIRNVRDTIQQYAEDGDGKQWNSARTMGSVDYRAAIKNCHDGTGNHIVVVIIHTFKDRCLGEAICRFYNAHSSLQPAKDYRNALLMAKEAVTMRVVLAHEIGHVLTDALHTTWFRRVNGVAQEHDHPANRQYDDNRHLAFSEWMAAISRQKYIHKRISDDPLKVTFDVLKKQNKRKIEYVNQVMGQGTPSPARRCRETTKSLFGPLRKLKPPTEDTA
jgi:hypothetical protein